MDEVLFTPEQVAQRLQVTERTVYDWIRAGKLQGTKLGRLWRIRPADLTAFIDRNRVPHKPTQPANDKKPLSPEDLAALRRGLEHLKAGRFVTLEQLDNEDRAWLDAGAEDAARRLEEIEADIPPAELKAYLDEITKRAKPVRWNPDRGEFEEVKA